MVMANEEIDFTKWDLAEQEQALLELSTILGVAPPDYSSMTDTELSDALHDILTEIESRPSAIITPCKSVEFEGDTIMVGS